MKDQENAPDHRPGPGPGPGPVLDRSWPFTGRDGSLAELTSLLADPARAGVLITGPVGVGKTRLARELLARSAAGRALVVAATESTAELAFGAFAHLLPASLPATGGRPNLLRILADALLAEAGDDRTLFVDDAHLLDDGSAALLLHLAVRGGTRIVLTARSGAPVPDAVQALLRGDYATRVEVPALDQGDVVRLLERALAGQVETASAYRLWQVSGGNVLWLRQLVEAGLAAGTLAPVARVWRWRGPLGLPTELTDLVSHRMGRLGPDEQRAAELLAFGEPLGAAVLEHLTGPTVVDALDRHGLVLGEEDGRRTLLRLAHPLYGEVLRRGTPPHRRRRRCRELAAAAERTGLRRRGDIARVGAWRLAAGDNTDPRFLLAAAEHAVRTLDFALAARLAEAACAAGGGSPARRVLAAALGHTGDGVQAEEVHRGLPQTGTSEREQVRSVQLRAANMYLSLDRPTDALDLLRRAESTVRDPAAGSELAGLQAVLQATQADWPACERDLARARPHASPGSATLVRTRYAECVAAFTHGRTCAALELAESALATLAAGDAEEDMPMLGVGLLSWLATAQAFAGRLDEAEATADAQYRVARESGWVGNQGAWQFFLGRIAARRGRLRSARRHMREAASTLREDTTWGQQALVFGELATIEALLGEVAEARTLLDRAHLARVESYRVLDVPAFQLARPWILVAQGRGHDAVRQALRTAADARDRRALLWEAELLHIPVRLGRSSTVARRLAELVAVCDAPHIAVYADHAAALAARDADALERACDAFEAGGLHLHAAEAAAQAARLWSGTGRTLAAQRAADRCHRLARRCEGVTTPAVLACRSPQLTDRERDVARLAAAGLSSRDVADRLGITVRTVDNHLYRVYRKTGVTSRADLREMLTPGESGESVDSMDSMDSGGTVDTWTTGKPVKPVDTGKPGES
ncbi:LuxR C-terminal-related transcriptional regulator [Streptomyces sp. NPDC002514]|uniref:helix-turn-helix transcriptional regulator n=1 Tax=Streptomyces sp. NPDC001270 TaxID=3364554 RepID=UPI003694B341